MADPNAPGSIALALTGHKAAAPALPSMSSGAARSVAGDAEDTEDTEDTFLPPGYLEAVATFDVAERELSDEALFGSAIAAPEALLVEHLIDGSLGLAGDAGVLVVEEIEQAYADAIGNIALKRSEIESVAAEMASIARFCEALSRDPVGADPMKRMADRLRELARCLQPGATGKISL